MKKLFAIITVCFLFVALAFVQANPPIDLKHPGIESQLIIVENNAVELDPVFVLQILNPVPSLIKELGIPRLEMQNKSMNPAFQTYLKTYRGNKIFSIPLYKQCSQSLAVINNHNRYTLKPPVGYLPRWLISKQ